MPDITTLPPELWRDITTKACTDGGFTGLSLALTNRFLHAQSFSTRFHSLALTSLARVEAFLAFLDTQPEECKPTIEHLYLSFVKETEPAKPPANLSFYQRSWEEQQKYREDLRAQKEKWNNRFIPAITRLFALAGPHLRSVCIVEDGFLPLPSFPVDVLPNLEELTVHGRWSSFAPEKLSWDSVLQPDAATVPFKLPSLRRLHYVGNGRSNPLLTLVKHAPPALTHLRFSDLSVSSGRFAAQLAVCLGVDHVERRWGLDDRDRPPPLAADRLSGLRHVVIHGRPPPPGGKCGTNYFIWASICNVLWQAAEEVRRTRGVEVVQMSRSRREEERSWSDRLYADWLGRMEGRDGCWVHSEEEEALLEVDHRLRRYEEPGEEDGH